MPKFYRMGAVVFGDGIIFEDDTHENHIKVLARSAYATAYKRKKETSYHVK
jgi:hypothetical protein